MRKMGRWCSAVLFGFIALPVCAAIPDYSHFVFLVKTGVVGFDNQGAAIGNHDSLNALKRIVPNMRPLVPASMAGTKEQRQALQRHRLERYFFVDTHALTEKEAEALILQLKQNPLVEYAEFEPRVDGMEGDNGSPIVDVARKDIPDYTGQQNYLQAQDAVSPYKIGGVNAVQAWKIPGGKVQGVRVVSTELNHWSYDHVDLVKPYLEINDSAKAAHHDTASVGTIASRENGFGTTGIAPQAQLGYAQWGAERLTRLAVQLHAGDVVQIGVQYDYTPLTEAGCEKDCFLPVERYLPVRDTIAYMTEERGAHVVMAAANGNINLDDPFLKAYFDRDHVDTSAIYAGAIEPRSGLRASYSDYGSRVDLFSWGRNVTTTSWTENNPTSAYVHTYSGTSSANPILAGVVASMQGVARANGLGNIPPKMLRGLLVATGYPQINGNSTEIGVQPDLDAAIKKMLSDGVDKPPVGRLALPEEVASGASFSAHVYAESPSNKPLTLRWSATGFVPSTGSSESMLFKAPIVTSDTRRNLSVEVSDGAHTLELSEHLTVKAPVGESDCGDIPAWDAAKVYGTYGEEVAYSAKKYKQNFYNVGMRPDLHSAAFGKEWQPGVDCP